MDVLIRSPFPYKTQAGQLQMVDSPSTLVLREALMRRRTLILLFGLCIVFVAGILGFIAKSQKRVQIGMPESEVEEILGGRGLRLDFRTHQDLKACAETMKMEAPPSATMKRWEDRISCIHVVFDSEGKVAGVYYPRGSSRYISFGLSLIGLH